MDWRRCQCFVQQGNQNIFHCSRCRLLHPEHTVLHRLRGGVWRDFPTRRNIRPFRYDICDLNERFSLFADLYSDFDVLDFGFFDIGLSPGISFDLTEHWSAEFSVGLLEYNWERVPDEKPSQTFQFFFETVAPSFGIYYNF